MDCRNHPGVEAVDRCAGCSEAFCGNCLVEIQGQTFCGACKVMAIRGQPPIAERVTEMCTEARDALIIAIIGFFCCAIILEPWALVKANNARKMIGANSSLGGGGMATAATIIAVIGLILWGIGIYVRFAQMDQA